LIAFFNPQSKIVNPLALHPLGLFIADFQLPIFD
jgi:hypothetical protein